MRKPSVTVFMPVFNGDRHLRESVESVLAQTWSDFELLIIDDGSTDASAGLLDAYAGRDSRISILRHDSNRGLVATRNEGLEAARAEFIAFLDCDDVARPERLARQVAFLRQHPDVGLTGSWVEFIDDRGAATGRRWKSRLTAQEYAPALLFGNCFATSSIMGRTAVLRPLGFRQEFPVCEDYDCWVRFTRVARPAMIHKVLVSYRVTDANTSARSGLLMETMVQRIVAEQLRVLGVPDDAASVELHLLASRSVGPVTCARLREAEAWLRGLLQANAAVRRYDPSSLARQVSLRWHLLCGNSGLGIDALRIFYGSPLHAVAPVDTLLRTKLLLKSLAGIHHA